MAEHRTDAPQQRQSEQVSSEIGAPNAAYEAAAPRLERRAPKADEPRPFTDWASI